MNLSEQYMNMSEKETQHKTVVVSSNDKGISSRHFNAALKHLKSMKGGESTDDQDKKGDLAPLLLFKLDLSGPVGATFTTAKLMDDSRIVFKNVTIDESLDEEKIPSDLIKKMSSEVERHLDMVIESIDFSDFIKDKETRDKLLQDYGSFTVEAVKMMVKRLK